MTFSRSGNLVESVSEGRCVRIILSGESSRRIASLDLPVTRVRLELDGFEPGERERFLSRFDLAYQKGGG